MVPLQFPAWRISHPITGYMKGVPPGAPFYFRIAGLRVTVKAAVEEFFVPEKTLKDRMVPPAAEGKDSPLLTAIPHSKDLGMRLVSRADDEAVLMIPYDEKLIGDPETRVMHGGAITALLDTCCGTAVMMSKKKPSSTATLDLRINYMKPAMPDHAVYAYAHCYRATRSVGFVRAVAYHTDPEDPVATASAAFILNFKDNGNG